MIKDINQKNVAAGDKILHEDVWKRPGSYDGRRLGVVQKVTKDAIYVQDFDYPSGLPLIDTAIISGTNCQSEVEVLTLEKIREMELEAYFKMLTSD